MIFLNTDHVLACKMMGEHCEQRLEGNEFNTILYKPKITLLFTKVVIISDTGQFYDMYCCINNYQQKFP